jgi:F-type H+-transporting ATPase subunit delta
MGESAVAIRYAEALYGLARDAGRTQGVLEKLVELKGALDADSEAWGKILDPRIGVQKKEEYLAERFLMDRDRLVGNLFRLILKNRRVEILRDFFRVYLEVHERGEGILRVQVETATTLEDADQAALWEKLEATTGKTVIVEPRVVPEILGGVRLIVESRVVDGSIRHRLERLKKELRTVNVGH